MRLYLMRHGLAERAAPGQEDRMRRLTAEGIRRLERQAAAMQRAGWGIERVFSSPYVRARQTADLVAPALGLSVDEAPLLACGCTLADVEELVGRMAAPADVMLIGHQPDLGHIVQGLTGSRAALREGMLAVVETAAVRPHRGLLAGLYDPDVMARLA